MTPKVKKVKAFVAHDRSDNIRWIGLRAEDFPLYMAKVGIKVKEVAITYQCLPVREVLK